MVRARLGALGTKGAMVSAFAVPQAEAWLDHQLERPAPDLDHALALAIDVIAQLRSDDAPRLFVDHGGARYADDLDGHQCVIGHSVRAPADRAGSDADGQEHLG